LKLGRVELRAADEASCEVLFGFHLARNLNAAAIAPP
jgi:hypothetical protein